MLFRADDDSPTSDCLGRMLVEKAEPEVSLQSSPIQVSKVRRDGERREIGGKGKRRQFEVGAIARSALDVADCEARLSSSRWPYV